MKPSVLSVRATFHGRRQARLRERALTHEVSTLRRVVAVALRDKANVERILADVQRDPRNGAALVRHVEVRQQLHVAEARIRDLLEPAS